MLRIESVICIVTDVINNPGWDTSCSGRNYGLMGFKSGTFSARGDAPWGLKDLIKQR